MTNEKLIDAEVAPRRTLSMGGPAKMPGQIVSLQEDEVERLVRLGFVISPPTAQIAPGDDQRQGTSIVRAEVMQMCAFQK